MGLGERFADLGPALRLSRERDEVGLLRLAQVATLVFARGGGRAERTDEVVDQLVAETQALAEALQRVARGGVGLGHDGSGFERGRERVHGGLVVRGAQHRVGVGFARRHGVLDVGELSGRRHEHGLVEQGQQLGAQRRGDLGQGDQASGLVQQKVAGEDRGGVSEQRRARGIRPLVAGAQAELPADVGHATALGVVVDDVVVHDEGGVQQFERGGHLVQRGQRDVGAVECLERGHHQQRAEALATVRRAADGGCQGLGAVAESLRARLEARQRRVDLGVDAVTGHGGRGEGDHDARLTAWGVSKR